MGSEWLAHVVDIVCNAWIRGLCEQQGVVESGTREEWYMFGTRTVTL